jgi:hypothetical protein
MGADMTLQVLPHCRWTVDREIELTMLIHDAPDDPDEFAEFLGIDDPGYYADMWDINGILEYKEYLIYMLQDYFDFEFRRDVTMIYIHKQWYLVTGGMTWGDNPTDSYGDFEAFTNCNAVYDYFEYASQWDARYPEQRYNSLKVKI